jgi:hypothetical protein
VRVTLLTVDVDIGSRILYNGSIINGTLEGNIMRGAIRMTVGFLITMGAIGTIDADPSASLVFTTLVAFLGVAIMAWGVAAMKSY